MRVLHRRHGPSTPACEAARRVPGQKSELDQCDPPKSLHYSGELFQRRWTFTHTVVRGAAAYSPFHRSKTHLVYTTDDLQIGFVDRIHFFGRAHPENRAYALPIGKVGLGALRREPL